MDEGYSKGETCNRDGCNGIINENYKEGGCSCHIDNESYKFEYIAYTD
jgi:hypothetical protein